MALLPAFTAEGLLPPGDYVLSIDQLLRSHLVLGEKPDSLWDRKWRAQLVRNLAVLVTHLVKVGVRDIFINGSFVERKPHPNDIDGYFLCDRDELLSGRLERRLRKLDRVWTWDWRRRRPTRGGKPQLPMWHKYRVELFPHVGQMCGIVDAHGNELAFPSAFRQTREFIPKGIIKIGGLT